MHDSCGKPASSSSSSSCLAITEKKPQRPGGCVGIFFQLFDWNRRLAKKKLFSKKLLPPARAKRASKKFGADDKLPTAKLLLIADENRGGFPNTIRSGHDNADTSTKGEHRPHEMRSPSLVARLMGLESMPAVRREKPKKALFSDFNVGRGKKPASPDNATCSEHFGCDQDEFHSGKGHTKLESRPQKLQKTGVFERRPVTRFGTEALQFRSVLSRTRKHHPKLASPVKSPRVGKNASRLIGAATKILEPGLHGAHRAKCSLTYSPSFHIASRDEVITHQAPCPTMDDVKQTNYYSSSVKPMKGQSSCKSCGNWLDVVDSRSNEEQVVEVTSSALGLGSAPPLGPGRSRLKSSESILEERPSLSAEAKNTRHSRSKISNEMKHVYREYEEQYHASSQRVKYQTDAVPATACNTRTKRQSQMLAKDRGNVRPKSNNISSRRYQLGVNSVDGSKDFIAVNRSSASRTKASMPPKVLNSSIANMDRNALGKKDDYSSRLRGSTRKRRPINGTAQVENGSFNQPTFRKLGDVRDEVIIGRLANSSPKHQSCVKDKLPGDVKGDDADCGKDIGVVSFTFSSPMKQGMETPSPTIVKENSRGYGECTGSNSSPRKKLTTEADTGKSSSRIATHLRGDALGALLEEKLKELTSRDRDELETGDHLPGKSTAAILEELILALTAERPASMEIGDNYSTGLSQEDRTSYTNQDPSNDANFHCPKLTAQEKLQAEPKSNMVFVGFPFGGNGERHSPGSVLDASFSNDSCFSESLDSCHTDPGNKLLSESVESYYSQPQTAEYDAELSDCATSVSTARTRIDRVTDSLVHTVLYNADNYDMGYVGTKLNYALEVFVNADLLLGSLCDAHSAGDLPIVPLLDKLEAFPDAPWTTSKDGCHQRRFLLDCLVEFLDSNYGLYCKSRFNARPFLSLQTNEESLTREVHEEIQRWEGFVGKSSDEMLEKEMNHSLGKWMDFEMEACEVGEIIESNILQILVNEVVIDLKDMYLSRKVNYI